MMLGGLYGVVHLQAMPGDPGRRGGGFAGMEAAALADAEALVDGGCDGVVVENFGSVPFVKGTAGDRLPPHQVAAIALVARAIRERFATRVGINCLRNDALAALGIAAATAADFVRVNVHTGAYLTDQGVIEGEAATSLRYRDALSASGIAIAADVLVKHAIPLAPLDAKAATRDCIERGLADAVIVTGDGTGRPVDPAVLAEVREAASDTPVLLGSGLTAASAPTLAPLVEGAIVGTALKRDGLVRAPVDRDRVRRLADLVRGRFRPTGDRP